MKPFLCALKKERTPIDGVRNCNLCGDVQGSRFGVRVSEEACHDPLTNHARTARREKLAVVESQVTASGFYHGMTEDYI